MRIVGGPQQARFPSARRGRRACTALIGAFATYQQDHLNSEYEGLSFVGESAQEIIAMGGFAALLSAKAEHYRVVPDGAEIAGLRELRRSIEETAARRTAKALTDEGRSRYCAIVGSTAAVRAGLDRLTEAGSQFDAARLRIIKAGNSLTHLLETVLADISQDGDHEARRQASRVENAVLISRLAAARAP